MQSNDLFSALKRFDAYPKTLEDFRVKTLGGGAGMYYISSQVVIIISQLQSYFLRNFV